MTPKERAGKDLKIERTHCPYCHEDKDGFSESLIEHNEPVIADECNYIRVYLRHGKLNAMVDVWDEGGFMSNIGVNYCPMCGRFLGKKDHSIDGTPEI